MCVSENAAWEVFAMNCSPVSTGSSRYPLPICHSFHIEPLVIVFLSSPSKRYAMKSDWRAHRHVPSMCVRYTRFERKRFLPMQVRSFISDQFFLTTGRCHMSKGCRGIATFLGVLASLAAILGFLLNIPHSHECPGNGCPTPTDQPIPSIAGNYAGSFTWYGQAGTYPMQIQITQVGSTFSGTTNESGTIFNDTGTITSDGHVRIIENDTMYLDGFTDGSGHLSGTWGSTDSSSASGTWSVNNSVAIL